MTNAVGVMVSGDSFRRTWRAAVATAGLPTGTRFHDLRHLYASTLIAAGLHPKLVQARLRHARIAETMDRYGHLFPESESRGRGAIAAAFEAVRPESAPGQRGPTGIARSTA
jgi:integrase